MTIYRAGARQAGRHRPPGRAAGTGSPVERARGTLYAPTLPSPRGTALLQPVGEHELLLFWLQLVVLLVVARLLGEAMRRVGQPAVVGELSAGLLLGPSVFGRLFPDAARWLFPGGEIESALLLGVATLGVALLLVITGFETDVGMLRRLGKASLSVAAGSLVLPLAAGFAAGLLLPARFLGPSATRSTFAMFVAVAISISALAVSGRILTELNLMRRDIGQVIVGVAMANELLGWVLLGLLAGIVLHGGLALDDLLVTVGLLGAFLAAALTIGQRLVDRSLRGALALGTGTAGAFTVSVIVAFASAAITQAIGVEAALGAFVAGIVLGRSRYQREEVVAGLETVTTTVFAPIFFATAGIYVDLDAIDDPANAMWVLVLFATATLAKFLGVYAGARVGGMRHESSVAAGVGLNARGTLEIVLATIALALGVFDAFSYSAVVVVAMASSLVVPPLLRVALRRVEPEPAEARRLEREETLATSVIASTDNALLPTRGGENSRLAAEVLDLVLHPEASVTILTVHSPDHGEDDTCVCDQALAAATAAFHGRRVESRRAIDRDAAAAVLREAALGYGLLALGMTEGYRDVHEVSPTLAALLSRSDVPLLLVRHGTGDDGGPPGYRRIVVPAVGTRVSRAGEEIAFTLAERTAAAVDLVHVVPRGDASLALRLRAWHRDAHPTAEGLLAQALERAARFGVVAEAHARVGPAAYEGLMEVAQDRDADAIVLGAQLRSLEGRPFLGHGTEYLLEHAKQTVIVVVFPSDEPVGPVPS